MSSEKKFVSIVGMKSLLEVLSENVRFYRKKTGLSQLKLAYQIEIAPSYLAEIERGKQYPSLKVLEKIADYFKIEAYQLLYPLDTTNAKQEALAATQSLRLLKQEIDELIEAKLNQLSNTNTQP